MLALVDVFAPPLVCRSELMIALFFGAIAAQLGLMAIWAVLGAWSWFVRFPATFGVMLLFAAFLCMGIYAAEPHPPGAEEVGCALLFFPLVLLAPQPPLWIARFAGGWRLLQTSDVAKAPATKPRQFLLQDLLGVMAVVALALGLASLGLWGESEDIAKWGRLFLVCLLCAVWSAFSTLPCLWACFVARGKRVSAVVLAVYVLVMTAIARGVISEFAGAGALEEEFSAFLMFHTGLVGTMLGVLHRLRRGGYVLQRAARKRPTTPPPGSPRDADPGEPPSPFEPHVPE